MSFVCPTFRWFMQRGRLTINLVLVRHNSGVMSILGFLSQDDQGKMKFIKGKSSVQYTHHAQILSSFHQCTLFKSNTTQQGSLFKHHTPHPPCCGSTASLSEGWNDQREIVSDWLNTLKQDPSATLKLSVLEVKISTVTTTANEKQNLFSHDDNKSNYIQ